jgi:hypothetical protein
MKLSLSMLLMGCCIAFAQGQSQGQGNPFTDKSDTGETVKILPIPASLHSPADTQPTDAPPKKGTAVYPASYGSGNLIDHGGFEIPSASYLPIYWNSSVANSTATSLGYANLSSQIGDFVSRFSDSANWNNSATADYTIVQQYGSSTAIAATLAKLPDLVDSKSATNKISDSQIQSYLTGLFNSTRIAATGNTIYGVYLPAGMKICLQGGCSCSSFCGYHSHFSYGNTQIKYAVYPYPNCSACSLPGKSVADMLTIVSSHEIREAVTDPGDFGRNAWYDAAGYEADDKCAWHNLYQMTNGGFWVQPEYSNGGTRTASGFTATYPGPGCVVPNR